MDTFIIKKAKDALQKEKDQKKLFIEKKFVEKEKNDKMLEEAQKRKEFQYKDVRKQELNEVSELREAIEKEKRDKKEKRVKEREAAWKVIRENEIEKEKRLAIKQ